MKNNINLKERMIFATIASIACLIIYLIFFVNNHHAIYFIYGFVGGGYGLQFIDYFIKKLIYKNKIKLEEKLSKMLIVKKPGTFIQDCLWDGKNYYTFEGKKIKLK